MGVNLREKSNTFHIFFLSGNRENKMFGLENNSEKLPEITVRKRVSRGNINVFRPLKTVWHFLFVNFLSMSILYSNARQLRDHK